MSYVNYMCCVSYMSYLSCTSYVSYECFMNHLNSLEITWIALNIFVFRNFVYFFVNA